MDNNQFKVSKQEQQEKYIKLELLDTKNNLLDELQGLAIDGNISLETNNTYRRNCSLTMYLKNDRLLPTNNQSKIWLDKKFRLLVGIKNIITDEIVWFDKGIFIFQSPDISYDGSSKTLSIQGVDEMKVFEEPLEFITRIPAETPLFDAIKMLISLKGFNKYIINDVENLTIPYDMEKSATDTIYDFLVEIRDLYMNFDMYINENGYFVFEKIKNRKYDMVEWEYGDDDKFVINYKNTPNWDNVKNKVVVYGMESDDGSQIKYTMENINDNQFGTQHIGEKLLVIEDDKIQTLEQAKMRCEYELYLHSNLNDGISFDCVQNFGLDVNKLITVNKKSVGIEGNYLVDSINSSLGNNGVSNITAHKMYY